MPEYIFIPAKSNEIQIDWDLPTFSQKQETLWLKFGLFQANKSKNGNWHIRLFHSKPLGPIQRIILARMLGDDPIRTKLNMRRARFL